ncbi:MAG: WG repeat-containing protein, partial [Cyclobacteriaceae bacterium]
MPVSLKIRTLILCLSLLTSAASATEYSVFVKNNLKGLVDEEGNEIIPARYDDIGWSAGATSVVGKVIGFRERNSWGLINTKNEKITRARFSYLLPYTDKLIIAGFRKDGTNRSSYALINDDGKEVSKERYDYLLPAGDRLIAANNRGKDRIYGLIDEKSNVMLSFRYSMIRHLGQNRYAVSENTPLETLYDGGGNLLTNISFHKIEPFNRNNTIATRNGRLGMIDSNGNTTVPFAYQRIKYGSGENKVMPFAEWKILTAENELITKVNYDSVIPAGKNLYRARSLDGELIMNKMGKELTDYCRCSIAKVYDDYAMVMYNGKYGLLSRDGEWMLSPSYDSLIVTPSFYLASSTGKTQIREWFMLNKAGEKISEYDYQTIVHTENGLLPVKRRTLWGYMDRTGKEVIPAIYQKVQPFFYEMAVVDYMGAQGVISRDGSWVISPKEGSIDILSEDRFLITNRWGNHIADRFRRPVYETDHVLEPFDSLHLQATTKEGKIGLVDLSGNMVLSTIYDAVSPLMQDTVYIFDKGEKRGLLSKSGRVMVPIENEFEEFHDMHEDFFGVRIGEKYGFVDVNGDLRIANRYDSIGYFSDDMAP